MLSKLIFRNLSSTEMSEKDANGYVMKIASEAITNIRTIASLSMGLIVLFFVDFGTKILKY